jgi:mannose-6-phosphate isomerase-like protein (cupin superfamily)
MRLSVVVSMLLFHLYIEKQTVHVHLADQERDLHAGGTVFIPAYTWVSVRNAGSETVSVVGVFQRPASRITCL